MRLVRYDARITSSILAATFARWQDRAIAIVGATIVLLAARSWMFDRLPEVARWTMFGGGALVGVACGRAIGGRLAFHAAEGPLAAEALSARSARRYRYAGHLAGAGSVVAMAAVVRLPLLPFAVGGYVAGALAARGAEALVPNDGGRRGSTPDMLRAVRSRVQRRPAGAAAAVLLVVALALLSRSFSETATLAATAIGAVALALALTPVNDAVVRFMAIAGFGTWRTIWRHAHAVVPFIGLGAFGCALAVSPLAGGVIVLIGLAALLLLALRVLVYRLHARRVADPILTGLAALLAFVAVAVPVLLPFLAALALWHFDRRAAGRTWIIA